MQNRGAPLPIRDLKGLAEVFPLPFPCTSLLALSAWMPSSPPPRHKPRAKQSWPLSLQAKWLLLSLGSVCVCMYVWMDVCMCARMRCDQPLPFTDEDPEILRKLRIRRPASRPRTRFVFHVLSVMFYCLPGPWAGKQHGDGGKPSQRLSGTPSKVSETQAVSRAS